MSRTVILKTYAHVMSAYRNRELRQALFDDGVVMQDVLINLHGEAHRARRRLENRLFRRDTFEHYERELFPSIIMETLEPHRSAGRAELVSLGHQLMMNLGALSAGLDRPEGTPEETFRLYGFMMTFIEGATIADYLGDREALEDRVRAALVDFDVQFVRPSKQRRLRLLSALERNEISESELPKDVLTVLLRNVDQLALPDDVILRETAFFLLSGAHTTATSFTRTMHRLLLHFTSHPEDRERARSDRRFLQQAVHEVLRLEPPSPLRRRRAVASTIVGDAMTVDVDDMVDLDLVSANRDRDVFGATADEFDPHRLLPSDVAPWGTSFGTGMHACIGQDMAAGTLPDPDASTAAQLFGLVPVAIQAVLSMGVGMDPQNPPELDVLTSRGYFKRYPVLLG